MHSTTSFSTVESGRDAEVFTLVVWAGCLAIGLLGLALPYARPLSKVIAPPATVEMLRVELRQDPQPQTELPPKSLSAPAAEEMANVPPPMAVAEPSPAIAFAMPVVAPARVVEARRAVYVSAAPPKRTVVAPPVPQTLIFGQGEGRQPAPDYPTRAEREGQEGNVTVRLTVGDDGHVLVATSEIPSPWPLLNQAALRAVKDQWKFPPGPVRVYDVAIRFELTK